MIGASHNASIRRGRKARLAALPLAGLLLVAGCANQPSNENRTRLEGAGIGAAIGGLAGALIGGRDGAAWGAAIGGGIGLLGAEAVNRQRRSYSDNAQRLEAEQRIAGQTLTATRAYNQGLVQRVANLDGQAARYAQARAAGRADLASAKSLREEMESEASAARENLSRLEAALGESRRQLAAAREEAGRGSADVASLELSIRALEGERDGLRASIDRISASMRRI
jgi:hypothetical protein